MPQGKLYSIKAPLSLGDTGYCIFADKSLDAWMAGSGGITDPADTRIHSLNDAIFVPGLVPISKQTQDNTTDLVITAGKAQMRAQQDGKFVFTNGTNELINLLDQLLTVLTTQTFTLTALGPQPFIAATNTLITQIQTKLRTLEGS